MKQERVGRGQRLRYSETVRPRFIVLGVTGLIASLFLVAEIYLRTLKGVGGDFSIFWQAAQLPIDRLYSTSLTFVHPPSSLLLVKAVGLGPEFLGYLSFMGLSLAAFYWAGRRLYSRTAVLMGLVSPAMLWAVGEGQMAPFLSALMFLAFSSPSVAKGALVAVVLSIKPQFAFIAPFVLWSDREAFLSMAATGLGLLVLSVGLWGTDTWVRWVDAIPWFSAFIEKHGIADFGVTLAAKADFYGLPMLPFLVLALCLSVYFAITKPIDDMAVLIVGCSVFASPYALPYDLVALAPWAAERLLRDKVDWRAIPNVLLYLHFLFPVAWVLSLARKP